MQKEDFEFININLNVRVELSNRKKNIADKPSFYLYGTILRVSDDAIVFKTDQKTSILRMCDIKSVVEW